MQRFTILIVLILISTGMLAEKYTLVIEPTFPVEQGKQVYAPLREWLSKKTGHDLEIIIDKNYYFYWRSANGSRMPDFTFDAPHIAAFRAKEKNYKAMATTMEPLSFHLVSLDEPGAKTGIEEYMTGKKIVMLPNPSLAATYYSQWFTNLFTAPKKDVTALSWQESIEIVFDGSADAAIVPNWMFNLYPNFASLLHTEDIPGTTFMASPKVPQDVVEKFQNALLTLIDDEAAYDVLVELNTEGFKKADETQFEELLKLLPE